MTTTDSEFDVSDSYFVNDEWPRIPRPLDGLNETDSAIVRWLGTLAPGRATTSARRASASKV